MAGVGVGAWQRGQMALSVGIQLRWFVSFQHVSISFFVSVSHYLLQCCRRRHDPQERVICQTRAPRAFFDTEDLGGTFVHCLDPRLRNVRLAFLFVPVFLLRDESSIFVAVGVAEPCGSGTEVMAEGTAPLCCSFCRARWSISSKESC